MVETLDSCLRRNDGRKKENGQGRLQVDLLFQTPRLESEGSLVIRTLVIGIYLGFGFWLLEIELLC
jgi:hypothetical protein